MSYENNKEIKNENNINECKKRSVKYKKKKKK